MSVYVLESDCSLNIADGDTNGGAVHLIDQEAAVLPNLHRIPLYKKAGQRVCTRRESDTEGLTGKGKRVYLCRLIVAGCNLRAIGVDAQAGDKARRLDRSVFGTLDMM